MTNATTWRAGLLSLALVAAFGGSGRGPAARADDADPTDVGLGARVRERLAAREAARLDRSTPPGVTLDVRRGEARFVRELARVDVTLEATNTNGQVVEWSRVFAIDPRAEVIRCALERAGQAEIAARTLTFEDGRRIYGETVQPQRPTGRDPLRVEREIQNQLRVTVFPLAPNETVRVKLAFVTPLMGRGRERVYLDPLWLTEGEDAAFKMEAGQPPARPLDQGARIDVVLAVEPRGLVFTEPPSGLVQSVGSEGRLAFAPASPALAGARAELEFLAPEGPPAAVAVKGGGLGTRVAVWRFDPATFLAERRLVGLGPRTALRLSPLSAGVQRLVPGLLTAGDAAQPIAARVLTGTDAVAFAVDVDTPEGARRFEVTLPIAREDPDEALEDAVSAWHRARMARHVLRWAGSDPVKLGKAIAYAVDLGVLLPGTSALAMPREEQLRLSRASRRTYRKDGALLGSPDGSSDFIAPPAGSLR